MNAETKLRMFTQVRLDIRRADLWSEDMKHGTITPAQASELLNLIRKADASATAFERAMQGVEPPKVG